jgi:hypothetical protein
MNKKQIHKAIEVAIEQIVEQNIRPGDAVLFHLQRALTGCGYTSSFSTYPLFLGVNYKKSIMYEYAGRDFLIRGVWSGSYWEHMMAYEVTHRVCAKCGLTLLPDPKKR